MTKTDNKITLMNAVTKGDIWTKLSIVIFGAGMFGHRQKVKGILTFLIEIAFFFYMLTHGLNSLAKLPGLGDNAQGKVWNEAKGIFEYTQGDNSLLILLFGIVTLFVIAAFVLLWVIQLRHSYYLYQGAVKIEDDMTFYCRKAIPYAGSVRVPF